MNDYEQRKQDRIDRYRERAANARQRSDSAYNAAHAISDVIPFGQPILVGHHSEKRHRRDLAKIDNGMRRSFEESKKAEYWEQRAAAAEENDSISRHDPDALDKLRERIAELRERQENMKAVNKAHKAFLKKPASLDAAPFSEAVKAKIRSYKPEYSWLPHPFAPYQMQNNLANIKRLEARLVDLQRTPAPAAAPVVGQGVTVEENQELDGIEVKFAAKPSAEVLAKLKQAGFRWSRRQGVWYRRRNAWAQSVALKIAEEFNAKAT